MFTCSGLSPGGNQVYSSRAQPESSSDCECRRSTSHAVLPAATPGGWLPAFLVPGDRWRCEDIICWWKGGAGDGAASEQAPEHGVTCDAERVCSSRGHLQLRHTFLFKKKTENNIKINYILYWCRFKLHARGPLKWMKLYYLLLALLNMQSIKWESKGCTRFTIITFDLIS